MGWVFAFILSILSLVSPVFAYPQAEFDDCVISSKENPEMVNVDGESIESFCDCALTKIFDENKIDNLWMNVCIRDSFN